MTSQTAEKTKKAAAQQVVSMRQLLEAGVHFGHQTRRWNPKMGRYIFTSRNDIHVIDLKQTAEEIVKAYQFIKDIVSNHGTVLFVGTKKQAQEAIRSEAERCKMPFVDQRWLGGTLTNNVTIKQSMNKLRLMETDMKRGVYDQLGKKEQSQWNRKMAKLTQYLGGIRDLAGLPAALFIVDIKKEQLAVREARRLGIPIVGLVDTNCDPDDVDYVIPGNDDALRAIRLVCSIIADAVEAGAKELASKPAPKVSEKLKKSKEKVVVAKKKTPASDEKAAPKKEAVASKKEEG